MDGLNAGTWGRTTHELGYIDQVFGKRAGGTPFACMRGLWLPVRPVFLCDTHVNYDRGAGQLAEITVMAA